MFKKIVALAGAGIILAATGAACSAPAQSSSAPQPVVLPAAASQPAGQQVVQTSPLQYVNTAYGAAGDGGFFECRGAVEDGYQVVFTSFSTAHQWVYCDIAGCEHNREECPAYLGATNVQPLLVWLGGQLVVGYTGNPIHNATEPDEANKVLPSIVTINPTEEGHRTVAVLGETERLAGGFALDNNAIYTMVEVWDFEKVVVAGKRLLRINLADGAVTELASFAVNENATLEGVTEQQLLVATAATPVLGSTKAERSAAIEVPVQYGIHAIPRDGSPLTTIKEWQQDELNFGVQDGMIFYATPESSILMQNPVTQEETLLAENVAGVNTETTSFNLLDNENLIFSVLHMDGALASKNRYCLNIQTGEVFPLTLSTVFDGETNPVSIIAKSEENFLVVSGLTHTTTGTNESPDYFELDGTIAETRALIPKADYYANEPAYTEITLQASSPNIGQQTASETEELPQE